MQSERGWNAESCCGETNFTVVDHQIGFQKVTWNVTGDESQDDVIVRTDGIGETNGWAYFFA